MKKLLIFAFICFLTNELYSQYEGFMSEYFFGRQPSARAEAIGKGYSSIGGDINSNFYNPAGISLIDGTMLNFNYASPYYLIEKGNYAYIGLGYKFDRLLKIGLSCYHFSNGDNSTVTDENNNLLYQYKPYSSSYTITIASNPIKNLHIGINSYMLLNNNPKNSPNTALLFDLGLIEIIPLIPDSELINSFQIGGSINNVTNSKMTMHTNYMVVGANETEKIILPIISRIGICYKYGTSKNANFKELRRFQLLSQIEYQNILNYKYYTAYRIGGEINILEILALRCGYFIETMDDYNNSNNLDKLKEFTYGFGLNIPIDKLTDNKIKLNIKVDYTNLPQPSATKFNYNWEHFTSIGFSINYGL